MKLRISNRKAERGTKLFRTHRPEDYRQLTALPGSVLSRPRPFVSGDLDLVLDFTGFIAPIIESFILLPRLRLLLRSMDEDTYAAILARTSSDVFVPVTLCPRADRV